MSDSEDNKSDYYDKYRKSKWAQSGSDPKNELVVREKFPLKEKEVESKIDDPGFWSNVKAMYRYVISGKDLGIKAIIVGGLVYFISPLDILPDVVPVLGYTDDIAIIAGIATYLAHELKNYRN